MLKPLFFSLLFAAGGAMAQQSCLTSMTETAPVANFTDNTDGTIVDDTTGITWMKCAIGQTYSSDGNDCTGDPTPLTWQEALQTAHGFTFNNLNGWRVPNMKELATLTERSCVRPSINETIFPNNPSDDFWTSTPSVTTPDSAWVIAFFNSSNSLKTKSSSVFLRLMRYP